MYFLLPIRIVFIPDYSSDCSFGIMAASFRGVRNFWKPANDASLGGFSLQTAYLLKKRIQSMEMKQNYFHRRKRVATVSARIKSGMGVFNAQVSHMEEAEAERITRLV